MRDCSEKVLNFFDFNTDYRAGRFDGASFLRFTELTSRYSSDELNSFMKTFKSRMDGNSSLAELKVITENGSKTYEFEIDVNQFFDLVRDKGASIFFSSIDYDTFCLLYEQNKKSVWRSKCHFSYTINKAGWLSAMTFSMTVDGDEYALRCTMDGFGETSVTIPEAFFDAAAEDGLY